MRRPRSPSRPARSERRRPRSDTSCRPESFIGTWTRRPSLVTATATATWRRFRPWNRPTVVSRTLPGGPGRSAQSTRRSMIAQPPEPHRSRSGRVAGATRPLIGPGIPRPPVARRSRSVERIQRDPLPPALSGLDDECGAGKRRENQNDPEGLSLDVSGHRSTPAHSGADREGHRCEEHQRPGEATQVRLHVDSF